MREWNVTFLKRQMEVRRMLNENIPTVDRVKLTVPVEDSVAKLISQLSMACHS